MNFKIILLFFLCLSSNGYADDLNDGIDIDKPIDDGIGLDKNIQFIIRKSLARASSGKKKGSQVNVCGSGNIVIGAGSKVKEVTNISSSKGTIALCGK